MTGDVFIDAESAASAISILIVIAVVAIVACMLNSWDVLLAGAIGSMLGAVIPRTYYSELNFISIHFLLWGFVGATVSCVGVLVLLGRNPKLRFSMLQLLGLMTLLAIAFALFIAIGNQS